VLCRLHVVNYALIDDVEIEFGSGLNIITGETGAGKSILIGALGLVLGVRANPDVIRTGEERCMVEAIFQLHQGHPCLELLHEMGIHGDEGELILRREVLSEGRSRCYANSIAIPVRSLQSLGKSLVDLHGQHDQQSLLDVDRHIDFIDGFGELVELRKAVGVAHRRIVDLKGRLGKQENEARRLREKRELLEFQVDEINTAAPEPLEDQRLSQELSLLTNAERLIECAVQLENILYQGEDSVVDRLGSAARWLEDAARMDDSLSPRASDLDAQRYGIEELARFFTDYAQKVEHNPQRMAEVEERLEQLQHLMKKYGNTLEEVLAYRDNAISELKQSEQVDDSIGEISSEIESITDTFSQLCNKLSRGRKKVASTLTTEIQKTLKILGMPDVKFQVAFAEKESDEGLVVREGRRITAGSRGAEEAEFHISTNPGESLRPLARVASGGEISRIMLAMKTVLAETHSVQVLIFDEIDIGISGRIAEVVGKKLKALSEVHQTISITHLPQIAKMADIHFSVRKSVHKGRTATKVVQLSGEARTEELAKLLGGEKISKLTLQHAREMLSQN
jgi:DNA repair protein RecN (Recombination protein N)